MEGRCPVCGRLFNVHGANRWAIEGLFLKHKDGCQLPEPGEFVKVMSRIAVVVSVDAECEEWPVAEVRFPNGRTGVYRCSSLGRFVDEGRARERFREMSRASATEI